MSTKLYEEAIAEAKQLRELAEQNAKNAIIEAVTPKIKSFIEGQLIGDASSNNDEEFVMEGLVSEMLGNNSSGSDVELSESEIDALMGLVTESSQKQALLGLIKRVDTTTKEKTMARNTRGDYLEIDLDDDLLVEAADTDADEYSLEEIISMLEAGDDDGDDEDVDGEGLDIMGDESIDELGLEELAEAILRMELDLGDDVDLPDEWDGNVSVEVADEEGDEEGESEEDDLGLEDEEPADAEEAPEDEEGDVDTDDLFESKMITISEADLRREIRKIKSALKAESLTKIKSLNKRWERTMQETYELAQGAGKENLKEGRNNRVLRGQLAEYRRATKSLRKQLTEMNLFNAKLLYVNKLLQNKGVTTGQRRSIIESIDKAKSLREVQLLYKSLIGSISKSKTLSESTVRKTLGSSSRVIRRASPRRTASTEVDRWATLAGLSEKD